MGHAFLEQVRSRDVGAVRAAVLEAPELIRATGEHGVAALHIAAELDDVEMASFLLDAGADPDVRASWGATALDWAATLGSSRVAELLIERTRPALGLVTAAAVGRTSDVRALLDAEVDLRTHRRSDAPLEPDDYWPADTAHIRGDVPSDALYAAARNGHDDVVSLLLDVGADVDAKGVFGGTGLHWAAINGHAETVALLVEHGADLTCRDAKFDATPEGWAREGGHADLAARLAPA